MLEALFPRRVTVVKHRLGGAFGCKISRHLVACATALAAFKLNTPVRTVLDMETNLEAIGKRTDTASDYEVGNLNMLIRNMHKIRGVFMF